jgi:predicted DCC family thiol-disulfide oxidoreductase YuxK
MARVRSALEANGFRPEPLQTPWVRRRLNLPDEALLKEMRLLTRQGQVLGGAEAIVYLASKLDARQRPWWAWLLAMAGRMPFAMPVWRAAYRWVAARRHCRQGECTLDTSSITKKEGIQ